MYLAGNLKPDFRIISDFRKENGKMITKLFKNTVAAAKDHGVIGLEQLSIDVSMVKASASNNSAVIEDVLKVIVEIATLLPSVIVGQHVKDGVSVTLRAPDLMN